MMRNTFDTTPRSCLKVITFAIILSVAAQLASAATINYGNFGPVPPGVTFLQVEESSGTDPVPLYGPPTPFATGLDFNPTNYVASTSGGGADLTDGQLNFTVMSNKPISNINLFERGDITLAGTGNATTEVQAGAVLLATVRAINGVNVAPINLPPVSASLARNLVANPGVAQPWSIGLNLNVLVPGATKIDVAINNALVAISQPTTVALIAKKDFMIRIDVVPEPTTALLVLASAAFAIVGIRRRTM